MSPPGLAAKDWNSGSIKSLAGWIFIFIIFSNAEIANGSCWILYLVDSLLTKKKLLDICKIVLVYNVYKTLPSNLVYKKDTKILFLLVLGRSLHIFPMFDVVRRVYLFFNHSWHWIWLVVAFAICKIWSLVFLNFWRNSIFLFSNSWGSKFNWSHSSFESIWP